ncbi:MAG: efflux RND transporter permease subunit, partial [Clostridia bacterium]|nr:efflux RND transporter permease subunit [Clostridia bacterium]
LVCVPAAAVCGLALGLGMGAGLVQPVAVVCIGGLIYATFMTLFIIPMLYDALIRRPPRKVAKEELELVREPALAEEPAGMEALPSPQAPAGADR